MLSKALITIINNNNNIDDENKIKIINYLNLIDYKFPNLIMKDSAFAFISLKISDKIEEKTIKYNKEKNTLYINKDINFDLNTEHLYFNQLVHILCTNEKGKVGIEEKGLTNINEGIIELFTNQIIPHDQTYTKYFDEVVLADAIDESIDTSIYQYLFSNNTIPLIKNIVNNINDIDKTNELFNLINKNKQSIRNKNNKSNLDKILSFYVEQLENNNEINSEKIKNIKNKLIYYNNQIQITNISDMYSDLDNYVDQININNKKILKKNK